MGKKKVYPTKLYIRFLVFVLFTAFSVIYRIKKKMPKEVKKLKKPYLLLSNHIGHWDPFVVGNFLPRYTHFVSSDTTFRYKIPRFFLTRLGTIPKKKNIRDTKVIRDIAAVIRQGENVGLFPEAVRSWAGVTFPMDRSIAKLIKMLNVHVIAGVFKGMNLFNPRWSRKLRLTRVDVEYTILLTPDQIRAMTEDEIFDKLTEGIQHDEVEWQRKKMHRIYSRHKAEHINHALYICPECHAIDSFRVKGNDFSCNKCHYDIHINTFGFFERKSPGKLYFDNIRDWYYWEERWLIEYMYEKFRNNYPNLIFEDENSHVFHASNTVGEDMIYKGPANIKLFIDRVEIAYLETRDVDILSFDDLRTINPQIHDKLEIFYKDVAYRVEGGRGGVSALKWEVAANAIWKKLGQHQKLSPYITSVDLKS